jgi:uncharacterized protein YjbI with pentapeptide repeats
MCEPIEEQVTKCLSIDKPRNEFTDYLLSEAKKEALKRIYGEAVRSRTEVKNLELISDSITANSIGIIKIKGDPRYYNGKDFAEGCVTIVAYITDDDISKFKLKKEVVNYCFEPTNDMTREAIKEKTRNNALRLIIARYNSSLKHIQQADAEKLVSDFNVLKGNYNSFGAYCIDAEGYVRPFDIEFYEENSVMDNPQGTKNQLPTKLPKGDCKRIRAETDLRHCNFKDAILWNQNLNGVDISGVDLSGANLNKAHFFNANLSNVNLQAAKLSAANLKSAKLVGANLISADLSNANLSGANLTEANLTGANLKSANFNKSTLIRAKLETAIFGVYTNDDSIVFTARSSWSDNQNQNEKLEILVDERSTNFTEADISNVDFYYVKSVSDAIYNKAIAKGATFNGVNLNKSQRKALKEAGAKVFYEEDEPQEEIKELDQSDQEIKEWLKW